LSAFFQPRARPTKHSATIAGKSINIKYSSPSVRGRQIFGDGGVVSRDSTYPVWRAGANAATTLQTAANLDVAGLNVPAGTYTLYVMVKDPEKWELIMPFIYIKMSARIAEMFTPDGILATYSSRDVVYCR
jgi:hypothetical protein